MKRNRVTLICKYCDEPFEVKASVAHRRSSCGHACPARRRERTCQQCGKVELVIVTKAERPYCSQECYGAAQRGTGKGRNMERRRAWQAQWRERNRERLNAKQRAYIRRKYRENPEYFTIQQEQRRARKLAGGGRVTLADWRAIKARWDHRCAYCRKRAKLEQDHVVPLSRGGRHTPDNVVPACRSCNARKSDRTPDEWLGGRPSQWLDGTIDHILGEG